tara:strand:+ start:376 stop:678 length:303 start_codon:yes stop_codon:yes gene_type:complete
MIKLPKATPKHLVKFHDTEAEQYAYCESIGCYFSCEWCVGYSESIPIKKIGQVVTKKPIIETKNEWDKLAQGITHKPTNPDKHPLLQEVLRLFTTRGGNK